jgi:predicted MPP superfamily phosphohydrolase
MISSKMMKEKTRFMILFFEKVIRDKTPIKDLFSDKRKILKSLFIFSLVIISIHIIHALTLDRIIEYKEILFYSSKISAEMDGYRIAFVADTHRMPEEKLKEAVKKLNEMQIDLLVLGGDYTIIPDAMRCSVEILSQIKTTDGIYGVEGNHDNYIQLFAAMEEYGITPLSNNGVYIRDNLFLAGVEDLWNRKPDIPEAIEEASPDNFVLLLAHNPDVTMKQDTSRVDLILSGHTHGGQITFLGIWAPYFTFRTIITEYGQRFVSGWSKSRDGVPVYVTNGTGEYMPRVFARPQVIIFTLRNEK